MVPPLPWSRARGLHRARKPPIHLAVSRPFRAGPAAARKGSPSQPAPLHPQWHCFLAQRRAVAARADHPADFGELHFWRWMAGPRCEIFERQSARRGVQVFAGTHRRPADERALKSAVAVGIFGASWFRRFDNRLLQSIFLGPNGLRHATFPMSIVAVDVLGHWAPPEFAEYTWAGGGKNSQQMYSLQFFV